MARIPYPDADRPELADLVDRIKGERGGELLNLYRMLLHVPGLADGWRALASALRVSGILDARTRELAICHVAQLTGSDYEWAQHAPLALREGVTEADLSALSRWRDYDGFTARDRAVLGYAEAVTHQGQPDEAVLAAVRGHLDDPGLVELTVLAAFYGCVARVLLALDVDLDRRPPGSAP